MPAPTTTCPDCKAKSSYVLEKRDPKTKKEHWKCTKCGNVISK